MDNTQHYSQEAEQMIALAAIFQFAAQVEHLAKHGQMVSKELELAVNSLYCQNPNHALEVYGRIGNLEKGLRLLLDTLRRKSQHSKNIVRYVMGVLHLQKRLMKNPSMLEVIGARIEKSQQQAQHFSLIHENVIAGLSDIYTDTISTFSFRIQVLGEYQYLQQARIANQIRTLLFAGIRAAVLWRQLGGSRLKIIFKRRQLLNMVSDLLEQAKKDQLAN